MKIMQTIQHPEELPRLPYLLAQLPRPVEDMSHLCSRLTLRGGQGSPEGELQVQLLLSTLRSIRQSPEHLQPFCEVANGFYMRRAFASALTGPLPVGNRVLRQTRLGVVMRH
jgi:hypothetical protein